MKKCKWCGQPAKYKFKITGEYCCSQYPQQCPEFKKKLIAAKLGKKRGIESIKKQSESMRGRVVKPQFEKIESTELCDYGCGKIARYIFKNGKKCCEKNYRSCEGFIKNKKIFENRGSKGFVLKDNIFAKCSWCGEPAKYYYKTGKYCCKESFLSCPGYKKIVSEKTKNKLSDINKKPIEYWNDKYPFFTMVEEMRYNPEVEGEIQVHCKNHNCPNSKEQGGWFTPTYTQFYERIRSLEQKGDDLAYFYCCDECKIQCPLYYSKGNDPFKNEDSFYTSSEYQTFREYVLKRDNYKCCYCGEPAEHVHHERPQKLEPFFSLDPDLAWSVCKKCHYQIVHKDKCSTGKLSSKVCI